MPVDISILPAFLAASFLLAISPGPDLLLVSSYSGTRGVTAGVLVAFGIAVAGVVQTAAVALGFATLMESAPAVATMIRLGGAAYFLVVGLRLLLGKGTSRDRPDSSVRPAPRRRLVIHGMANNLLNPKALLFFGVFLPGFATGSGPIWVQLTTLGLLLTTVALAVNLVVALAFGSVGSRIRRGFAARSRKVEVALGVMFIGLSTRLATNR